MSAEVVADSEDITSAQKVKDSAKDSAKESNRDFWKPEEEVLLKEWADKAISYYWMHLKGHRKYKTKNTYFTIPVIIISTITGTANFAQSYYGSYLNMATILIGSMNIIAGIITTIYQFLKISELNEGHKAAALLWCKFHETIRIELAKNPLDRQVPSEMLKYCYDTYVHLMEFSPIIPEQIIREFKSIVTKRVKDLVLPDVCGRFKGTKIFDEHMINLPMDMRRNTTVDSEIVNSREQREISIDTASTSTTLHTPTVHFPRLTTTTSMV